MLCKINILMGLLTIVTAANEISSQCIPKRDIPMLMISHVQSTSNLPELSKNYSIPSLRITLKSGFALIAVLEIQLALYHTYYSQYTYCG